jgi:hypothetical protein
LIKAQINIFLFQRLPKIADSSSTRRGVGEERSTLFKGGWMTLIHLNGVTVVAEPTGDNFVE